MVATLHSNELTMQANILIQNLTQQTQQIIAKVQPLRYQEFSFLSWKEDENSWSILECIEHLNRYSNFYFPQIAQKIKYAKHGHETEFKSGFLGGYFAKTMLPKEKLNKMKTFKDKNPLHTNVDISVIDTFLAQQNQFLELLQQAKNVSLNKTKVETSLTALLKLNLGDTFQFLINHIIRHLHQIDRIQTAMKNAGRIKSNT